CAPVARGRDGRAVNWAWIAVIGGVVGLDATSFPQAMLSRPLVAATMTGLVLGRPGAGLLVGTILEVFELGILPVGAARYPEGGPAAIAAAVAFIGATGPTMPALLLAVLFGLAWERVAGESVVLVRRWTERIIETADVQPAGVERRHALSMALDLVRGALVSVIGAAAGTLALAALLPLWGAPPALARAALVIAAATAAGATLTVFGGWTE